jgi:hypothetical protein
MSKTYNKIGLALAAGALSVVAVAPAFAASGWNGRGLKGNMGGIVGTVASINGSSITLTSKAGVTYNVNASGATITKGFGAKAPALPLSGIASGDTLLVRGAVTGTNVTATAIIDGALPPKERPGNGKHDIPASLEKILSKMPSLRFAGTVQAISGNIVTVLAANAVTYAVDVTSAKVMLGRTTGSIGSIAVGDKVLVSGTLPGSGTAVKATMVSDLTQK